MIIEIHGDSQKNLNLRGDFILFKSIFDVGVVDVDQFT